MDSILNKLTEIESAAVSIVQHAEAEKSILDEKYDEKRRQFDLELEAETKKQIQAIQDDLQKKTSQPRTVSGACIPAYHTGGSGISEKEYCLCRNP